jgi:regulation of enolase protein 1 (concanavalin A-like superfamily)
MSAIKWIPESEQYTYSATHDGCTLRIEKHGWREWWYGCINDTTHESLDGTTYSYADAKAKAKAAIQKLTNK